MEQNELEKDNKRLRNHIRRALRIMDPSEYGPVHSSVRMREAKITLNAALEDEKD